MYSWESVTLSEIQPMKEISRLVGMIQTIVVIVIVLSLLVFFPWQAIHGPHATERTNALQCIAHNHMLHKMCQST